MNIGIGRTSIPIFEYARLLCALPLFVQYYFLFLCHRRHCLLKKMNTRYKWIHTAHTLSACEWWPFWRWISWRWVAEPTRYKRLPILTHMYIFFASGSLDIIAFWFLLFTSVNASEFYYYVPPSSSSRGPKSRAMAPMTFSNSTHSTHILYLRNLRSTDSIFVLNGLSVPISSWLLQVFFSTDFFSSICFLLLQMNEFILKNLEKK